MATARRFRAVPLLIVGGILAPPSAGAQLRPPKTVRVALTIPAPQSVQAGFSGPGVQLSWQPVAEAVQYLVLRSPDGNTAGTQIGAVPAGTLAYLDAGFAGAATYQIVALAADGRRGASSPVAYLPPQKLVPPALSARAARAAFPIGNAPPVITAVGQPINGVAVAYNGDAVVVQGSGLDGAVVTIHEVYSAGGVWRVNAYAQPIAVTPVNQLAASFSFVPQVPAPYQTQLYPYFVIVTKGALADTSDAPLFIGATRPVRKITSVAQTVVRAGGRMKVNGVGFSDVIGGYFGPGTPGSATNPLLSAMNRSDTYVELVTPPDCNQEGILMLNGGLPPGGGTPIYITGGGLNAPIRVGCASGTPAGKVDGSEAFANGVVPVLPGSKVSIRGTNLRWVTKVIDQANRNYAFTYALVGTTEFLSVTLPATPGPYAVGLYLENALTDPVMPGTVTGSVEVMAAPTWNRISPAWAEAGQKVTVNGQNLKYSAPPQVWVGGVPAQVLGGDRLTVQFRVPAGASAGPIEIQNEVGKVQLTGPFTAGNGASHPGFFLVSGPSSVTQIVQPNPALAYDDVLLVKGQNLARLAGICVKSSGQGGAPAGYLKLPRLPIGAGLGYETSNTEMPVSMQWQPYSIASGPVQLYAPSAPVGDYPPSQFACGTNPAGISWP